MKSIHKLTLIDLMVRLFPESPRERLYAKILCSDVLVNGVLEKNPKMKVEESAEVIISTKRFVSRGGFKLEGALENFNWIVKDKIIIDAGASTGGFTDCLLQRGAAFVYAIDVGTNQLDWKLRENPRVKCLEKTNIMSDLILDPQPDWAVADLAFRSLRGAACHILEMTNEKKMIALIKPQFEWQSAPVEFEGIVPEKEIQPIVNSLIRDLEAEHVILKSMEPSSIRGRKGNQEFLAWLELNN